MLISSVLTLAAGAAAAHASSRSGTIAPAAVGSQLWVKRYNGPAGDDAAHDLAVRPNGSSVFITGYSLGTTTGADYATVAYSSSGTRLWSRRYDGSEHTGDVGRDVEVSPDGTKVFVTGRSHGTLTGDDYATVAYDAVTGKQLWVGRYTGPRAGDDEATSLVVSPDSSTVFVTGHSHGTGTKSDYATIAYNASTGAERWVSRYNGPAGGDDAGLAIAVDPSAPRVFVTGRSPGTTSGNDYATVAYNASTGAQLWVSRYDGPASTDDAALAVTVSSDGSRVFVTGDSHGTATSTDDATVAYDSATGMQLWASRYNGPANGNDTGQAIEASADGSTVFVTGDSHGSGTADDYATIAYDASNGGQRWARRYNGPAGGDDVARMLRLSPDGTKVYVTGHSRGSGSGDDYATVAYRSSTGGQLWVSRYNGVANGADQGIGVGVSPDGATVFVTGTSASTAGDDDFATVAISTA